MKVSTILNVLSLYIITQEALSSIQPRKKVVCYYPNWSLYRNQASAGSLRIEDIPVNLCTHVLYAFIGLNPDGSVYSLDPYADESLNGFSRVVSLKTQTPSPRVFIALGGSGAGSSSFSQVVGNPSTRTNAVSSLEQFLLEHGFDGVDINWMYPSASDKENFALFLTELKARLSSISKLLSVSVSKDVTTIENSYNITNLARTAHFVSVTAYDYHSYLDMRTGYSAPLYDPTTPLSVSSSINVLLDAGMPASKLVMGAPLFGRTFKLADVSANGVGAATNGPGNAGPYTSTAGILENTEICQSIQNGGSALQIVRNAELVATYMYLGDQWITYDSELDMYDKGLYAASQRLGGVMVWELTGDNPKGGSCARFQMLSSLVCGYLQCPREAEAMFDNRDTRVESCPTTQPPL